MTWLRFGQPMTGTGSVLTGLGRPSGGMVDGRRTRWCVAASGSVQPIWYSPSWWRMAEPSVELAVAIADPTVGLVGCPHVDDGESDQRELAALVVDIHGLLGQCYARGVVAGLQHG